MTELETSAREAAEEARLLFRAQLFRGACSRAYYAMFNAARAMLTLRGYKAEAVKTHKSVLRLFSLEFVKTGPFDAEIGQMLRRAAEARHVAGLRRRCERRGSGRSLAGARGLHAPGRADTLLAREIMMTEWTR